MFYFPGSWHSCRIGNVGSDERTFVMHYQLQRLCSVSGRQMKSKYGAWADRKTEVLGAKPAPEPFCEPHASE